MSMGGGEKLEHDEDAVEMEGCVLKHGRDRNLT